MTSSTQSKQVRYENTKYILYFCICSDCGLLGCNSVYCCRWLPMFQRNVLPAPVILMREAVFSAKTLVNHQQDYIVSQSRRPLPLDPRFAGSNLAENNGHLWMIKIHTVTSFRGKVKQSCHKILHYINDPCRV
jgi:hypothetical protein